MKLYGIPNCDTVRKARAFLDRRGTTYTFHDFRKDGVTESLLHDWIRQVGWQKLLKKSGPSWSRLPDEIKASAQDDAACLQLMLQQTNLIKRPVLEQDGRILALGFSENDYERLLP